MCCISCSAYACRCCAGALPSSTFSPGNLPNNTFHTVTFPCPGERATVICSADSSAVHNYPLTPALCGIIDATIIIPFASKQTFWPVFHPNNFDMSQVQLGCSALSFPIAEPLLHRSCANSLTALPMSKNLCSGVCCLMSAL
jgi:hypothetical protein